jgi:ABC-2 type transport system ATP-binding protein
VAGAISVRDLRVVRGGSAVLPGISLDVAVGLVTGLVGPSGSGKTTLMRAVGVQIVDTEVRVLGLAAGSPELRARVGYVGSIGLALARGAATLRRRTP